MNKKKGTSTAHVTTRDDSPALEDPGAQPGASVAMPPRSGPELPKRGPGAPSGRKNGNFIHGKATRDPIGDDPYARKARAEVLESLVANGLQDDPDSRNIAKVLRIELAAYYRCNATGDRRGWYTKGGEPKQIFHVRMQLADRIANLWTKIIDRLAALKERANPDDGIETRYLVETADGIVVGASWDIASEIRAAGGILPISGPEHVCRPPIPELSSRPAEPGADLPLEAAWARQEPAQADLSAGQTDSPSASTGPLLGARGAAAAKSLNAKVGRAIRSRPDDDPGVQRPGGVPEDAYFNGECWIWSRGDQTFMAPVVQRDRWTTIAEW